VTNIAMNGMNLKQDLSQSLLLTLLIACYMRKLYSTVGRQWISHYSKFSYLTLPLFSVAYDPTHCDPPSPHQETSSTPPLNSLSKNSTTPLLRSSKPQPLPPLFITAYSQPANAATPPPPPPPIAHSSPPDDKPRHAYTATSHNLPRCRLTTHDTATRINTFLRLHLVSLIEV
jgi:hypothetical protein